MDNKELRLHEAYNFLSRLENKLLELNAEIIELQRKIDSALEDE